MAREKKPPQTDMTMQEAIESMTGFEEDDLYKTYKVTVGAEVNGRLSNVARGMIYILEKRKNPSYTKAQSESYTLADAQDYFTAEEAVDGDSEEGKG
ncbi:hypothetical protein J2S43_003734 [Catenuloplanes nepalensis]|uniref:Uncharacterized protein n=1 Tax=Catenuloplanes nepalensis TaxID=587533 RepID=A0ABT9MUV8_9ACTN|nr:hypothetical protein [Catenuloplanes nepalensis]MDP9795222.1 hypothetical protein [Catenuloplanes nepalensis]